MPRVFLTRPPLWAPHDSWTWQLREGDCAGHLRFIGGGASTLSSFPIERLITSISNRLKV